METGKLSNRESSKPRLSQIDILKNADSSVAAFFREAVSGSAGQEAIITFVHTGSNKLREYMIYKLTNCIISKYKILAPHDAEPVVWLTLSYSAIEVSYTDHDASNKSGSPQRVSYDVKIAEAG